MSKKKSKGRKTHLRGSASYRHYPSYYLPTSWLLTVPYLGVCSTKRVLFTVYLFIYIFYQIKVVEKLLFLKDLLFKQWPQLHQPSRPTQSHMQEWLVRNLNNKSGGPNENKLFGLNRIEKNKVGSADNHIADRYLKIFTLIWFNKKKYPWWPEQAAINAAFRLHWCNWIV